LAKGRAELDAAPRGLTHVSDRDGTTRERVHLVFRPIAIDLGLDPADIDVIADPIVGPQSRVLNLPTDRRRAWSDLLLVHNATYHLLIGVDSRIQIDLPLLEFSAAIGRLRRTAKNPTSSATLGFLAALATSYKPCLVGATTPKLSALDGQWIDVFEEYIKDATYQEYAAIRSELGYRARIEKSVERTWVAARRLLSTATSRGLLRFTVRNVGVSVGLPSRAPTVVSDYFNRTRYLPPIVRMGSPLAHARTRWLRENNYQGTLDPSYEYFDWLPGSRIPKLYNGTFGVDREWFASLFTTVPSLDITQAKWQRALERYFAVNLESLSICQTHGIATGYDDVDVSWDGPTIEMSFTCCCEEGAREAFNLMCAFQPEKRAEYSIDME
jgi:hypothetical protein